MQNIIFLLLGILIGYFLNKNEKTKETVSDIKQKISSVLIKPSSSVIASKEENSLNKLTDDVNMHHNDYFDEIR